jgi:Rrf2 family cysteine metabolism transcriptional repressor
MKISTRSEYGLRALMELGARPSHPLSLRDIAQRQHISLDYLEQIMPALKAAGLIRARRGAQGGYMLARPAEVITVYDVLAALEGTLDPMMCLSSGMQEPQEHAYEGHGPHGEGCGASGNCAVQEVWQEVKRAIEVVLKGLTLAKLIERQQHLYGGPIRTYSEHEIMRLVVLN